jgi:hypothetical protein
LFFFQKKQPNLTRAVENRQINEEDNEIRYFVLLDIGVSFIVHIHAHNVCKKLFARDQLSTSMSQIVSYF